MHEKLKFIEGGFPLSNRVWIDLADNLTKVNVMNFLEEHISAMPESLTLEVHFFIKNPTEISNNNLIESIKDIYRFKTGYEKNYPVVSIYYPYKSLDNNILARINECDTYRPGIRLYVLVTDNDVQKEMPLSQMRNLAEELYARTQMGSSLGLDSTLLLYLEKDPGKLELLFELRRLTFTWDTASNMKKPLLQVAPNIMIGKNEIEQLSKYIKKEDSFAGILDTVCGFTSLLYKYNENKSIPTEYIPLGGCGAGISERKLCSDGTTTACFHQSESSIEKDIFSECRKCSHVSNCTGCRLNCTNNKGCLLKDVFDIILAIKE